MDTLLRLAARWQAEFAVLGAVPVLLACAWVAWWATKRLARWVWGR